MASEWGGVHIFFSQSFLKHRKQPGDLDVRACLLAQRGRHASEALPFDAGLFEAVSEVLGMGAPDGEAGALIHSTLGPTLEL